MPFVRRELSSEALRLSLSSLRAYFSTGQGVTAVQFALLAPAFFGVTFIIIQIGLYQLYSAGLSYATNNAARQILVGNVANANNISITSFLTNFVCINLPPPMTCNRLVVNSTVLASQVQSSGQSTWWTLINAQQTALAPVPLDNTKTSFCIGRSGSTVALEMYYAMPTISFPFFSSPSTNFNGLPVIWIVSTAAFRNEPFNTGYAGC